MIELAIIIGLMATCVMAWLAWEVRLLRKTYRPVLLIAFVLSGSANAQQPKSEVKRIPNAADAVDLAWLDLKSLPLGDQPFIRYLWISFDFTVEKAKALTSGINYVSRATPTVRLSPLLDGSVLRVDLRRLAPQQKDIEEWFQHWESLRFDPSFNLLITKDMFESVLALPVQPVARVRSDGKFHPVPFNQLNLKNVDVVRLTAPHLNLESAIALQDATGSAAPIVEARYFLYRTLTTLRGEGDDAGVWDALYSGIYYELAGIPESKDPKVTDEDLLFRQLGVGSKDETAEQVFDRLRSDQRVAVFRRELNKKPSRIDFVPTLVRQGALLAVTHDVKDSSIDIKAHPIMNLSKFKDDAREGIATGPNGYPRYVLYSGQGKLQRFVPQNVAEDRGIPNGERPILQGALSCIDCHEAKGPDGWQPVANDVQALLKEADVYADLTQGNKLIADTLDRLGGQYLGSPADTLQRARDDFAKTVLKATGPWKVSKGQTDVIKLAAKELIGMTYSYRYDAVDAQQALKELGFSVNKEQARIYLKKLLPPVKESVLGVSPEDPRIAALKAGLSLSRFEWDLTKAFAANRIKQTLESQKKEINP